ncbi:unnamed protein product [Sphagnum troendelagicum]|uniref:Roadblock/LAMTOR2 domain-containing protein n=1 Tax=Sphagnum troendelagicum TaxID=128251 RepID=A0ABP0UM67_9BRYO
MKKTIEAACSEAGNVAVLVLSHGVSVTDEKTKPELTKKLSISSKLLDSMSEARSTLHGLKAGQFSISCNFDGLMLSLVGAGMSPQHSLPLAVLEVMITELFRIVAFLC